MTSTPPGVYIQWRNSFHRNEPGLRKRKRRNKFDTEIDLDNILAVFDDQGHRLKVKVTR